MRRTSMQFKIAMGLLVVALAVVALPSLVQASDGPSPATLPIAPSATATPVPEPEAEPAESAGDDACAALVDLEFPETVIRETQAITDVPWTSPEVVFGKGTVATPFCRVLGTIDEAINFEVWLPPAETWNGKFNGVGNGGLAGELHYPAMADAIGRGYATASTDTGHTGFLGDGSWALDRPDLLVDFGYRSIHMTARAAKAVIEAYYDEAPAYSYFTGCSGGGQQALSEAQRYPADYDGIVAGAPANFPTHMWPGELYPAWVTHRDAANNIPEEKLPLINDAVLAACDANDGVEDGVLEDPRTCDFDPAALLCSGEDGADCLTEGELDSLALIYEGLQDPEGAQFWPPYEKSSELEWPGHIYEPFSIPPSYFAYMVFEDPEWQWQDFDFSDPENFAIMTDAHYRLGPILNATESDLSAFKELGGKLLMYHGWIDQNIAPRNSINYFEKVNETMGGVEATQDFLRLFMVPGMLHCGGGPGPTNFDALGALEQWVEEGVAVDTLLASHATDGEVDRTRPLCPYPQVAVYSGEGSTDEADSFICTEPE